MHTIVIYNDKGGVGATTVTKTLGLELSNRGRRVLLIDADTQASLTHRLDYGEDEFTFTLADILTTINVDSRISIKDARIKVRNNVDLVPSFRDLILIEYKFIDSMIEAPSMQVEEAIINEYFQRMRNALCEIANDYDYCLIDSRSGISSLNNILLQAATHCLIPASTTIDDYEATILAHEFIEGIKQVNPSLKNLGVVISSTSDFGNDQTYKRYLKKKFNVLVEVPTTTVVRAAAAQSPAVTVIEYNRHNKAAQAYLRLTDILLGKIEGT